MAEGGEAVRVPFGMGARVLIQFSQDSESRTSHLSAAAALPSKESVFSLAIEAALAAPRPAKEEATRGAVCHSGRAIQGDGGKGGNLDYSLMRV